MEKQDMTELLANALCKGLEDAHLKEDLRILQALRGLGEKNGAVHKRLVERGIVATELNDASHIQQVIKAMFIKNYTIRNIKIRLVILMNLALVSQASASDYHLTDKGRGVVTKLNNLADDQPDPWQQFRRLSFSPSKPMPLGANTNYKKVQQSHAFAVGL